MGRVAIYRTQVMPEWIDYNGHLRDAYYSLIVSLACDALMDRVGLDEAYRARTRCTLYTLEMHMHFLREVKGTDTVDVSVRILGLDRKRIHAAFDMWCGAASAPAASAELMLLHVHQGDDVKSQAFPTEVAEALERLRQESGGGPEATGAPNAAGAANTGGTPNAAGTPGTASAPEPIPGSRRMELRV